MITILKDALEAGRNNIDLEIVARIIDACDTKNDTLYNLVFGYIKESDIKIPVSSSIRENANLIGYDAIKDELTYEHDYKRKEHFFFEPNESVDTDDMDDYAQNIYDNSDENTHYSKTRQEGWVRVEVIVSIKKEISITSLNSWNRHQK